MPRNVIRHQTHFDSLLCLYWSTNWVSAVWVYVEWVSLVLFVLRTQSQTLTFGPKSNIKPTRSGEPPVHILVLRNPAWLSAHSGSKIVGSWWIRFEWSWENLTLWLRNFYKDARTRATSLQTTAEGHHAPREGLWRIAVSGPSGLVACIYREGELVSL